MKEAAGLGLCCIAEIRRRPSLKGDQDIHWSSVGSEREERERKGGSERGGRGEREGGGEGEGEET